MTKKSARLAFFMGLCLLVPAMSVVPGNPGVAQAAAQLSEDDNAAVTLLNTYLNEIVNMKGEFTQTSPRGQIANGVFYISKPGKMRFEYAPPSPLLVVSDGRWVTVKNTKRKKDDQYPLSATPLKLVLAGQVNLFEQAIILKVESQDNLVAVTMEEKDQLVAGQLTMVFDREANDLVQWIILDGKGQRTTVQLSNVDKEVQPDPKLFVVKRSKERKTGSDR
ncbi:LolA family protein [Anderseniella sp. Alg231-50]|uniref:LolA family protein n=1 Tax=Anderseniella sp. Alg231-50 TaxID=1922226 RepID=UPI00307B6A74